jgi:outer membrane protein OmpA-like peptidoglycan-associated protein
MRLMLIALLVTSFGAAQEAATTQQTNPTVHASDTVFRVDVVSRTAKAVNYRHRGGATKIDFAGTALLPQAKGQAKVESKQGYIEIEVEFENLEPARKYGAEYLTYVLWAITPDGRPANLGEVLLNGTRSKLNVTTKLQQFALIVTAEPYFAVSIPSDLVVMENEIRKDTLGKVDEIEAKYELLQRGQYAKYTDVARLSALRADSRTPLELLEARNALMIAESVKAEKYAADSYQKAREALNRAEEYLSRKNAPKKPVAMMAREAVQRAEDARAIAVMRADEERLARERADAAAREAAARARAEKEAQQRAEADAARIAAENRRKSEEEARLRAEADRLKALAEAERSARQQAEAARLQAEEQARRLQAEKETQLAKQRADEAEAQAATARQAVAEAQRLREEAERERQRLRQQLLDQLNIILETRDSARGLIVNMSDVLFDFGKFALRPAAREKLAKLSGIVLAHSGLKLAVEGHTDSIGSEEFNQKLSEQRANAVRDYLVSQGLKEEGVTAEGFGKELPVASNATNEGRQRNRRVEIVVSGDIIGTAISSSR